MCVPILNRMVEKFNFNDLASHNRRKGAGDGLCACLRVDLKVGIVEVSLKNSCLPDTLALSLGFIKVAILYMQTERMNTVRNGRT